MSAAAITTQRSSLSARARTGTARSLMPLMGAVHRAFAAERDG